MKRSLVIKILLGLFIVILTIQFYPKLFEKEKMVLQEDNTFQDTNTSSNVIKDVNYSSKDVKGNEYFLYALEGQIDINNNNIIFLKQVDAKIKLVDGETININSDFGKYNIDNYDTIFSKNVIINYIDNKITGNYLDFSLNRNSLIISKNVVYLNQKNFLKADVVEINITSKDAKIFMYDNKEKVKIKSIN